MKKVSKTKKNTEIRHIKVEAKHRSVIKPFGPSKTVTEQIPSTALDPNRMFFWNFFPHFFLTYI